METVLELAHPWLLLLLPLPVLAWRFLPPYRESRAAIRAPFFREIAESTGRDPERGAVAMRRSRLQMLVASLVWLLFVVALAGPQWVEDPIVETKAARDLLLAVDLSGSMETDDFEDETGQRISRLDAVKQVLDGFIERREGDRIGLIVFGSAAYLQAPFTEDHDTVRYLLDETRVRMAGPQTMMGDAIGFAIPRFEESSSKNPTLILLTDGNDTGSRMPPDKAADIAAKHGITIHTIAMGDPTTVGESALDLEALETISKKTQGRFFRADDREALEQVYEELDRLDPGQYETLSWRPRKALFPWALGLGLGVLLLFEVGMILRTYATRRRRRAARA